MTVFTGLVSATGMVAEIDANHLRIEVQPHDALAEGASIAINGVCLTVVEIDDEGFEVDVMAETLRRSSLGALTDGDRVNLEMPLRVGDPLDGHVVQGHVDGTGTVAGVRDEGVSRVVRIEAAPDLLRYVVQKGSIAVDGVSLTVSAIEDGWFEVSLIPETIERTTLGEAAPGRVVNLEVDVLAKYLEKLTA
ncbi:MAG: riboflavin synthase [Thermoleophilaceae bacterium]